MSPSEYLIEDHRRLETLLTGAMRNGTLDHEQYNLFRAGQLRHVAIEETLVLPTVRQHNGGFFGDRQIHLEHLAITALLLQPPSDEVLHVLRALLEKHTFLEETNRTLYDALDACCAERHPELLQRMQEYLTPPVPENAGHPDGLASVRRAVARAGYDYDKLAG